MIRVGIVLFDGVDELDAIAPWEVLRSSVRFGAKFETKLFALDGATTIEANYGLKIVVDAVAEPEKEFDWILVPGGAWATRSQRGAWGEIERGKLPNAIREWRARGLSMASVCTGAMILSAAGITRDRTAVTHHVALDALRSEGANVSLARVVDDGDLVTAGGVTSGIDLALWLIERFASREIADRVQSNMEYHRVGRVHFGAYSQHANTVVPKGLANTPNPPYIAVIFTSLRTDGDNGYAVSADQMVDLASQSPGFLGVDSVRDESGLGVTVSYWRDHDSVRQWKQHAEHTVIQRLGRQRWYEAYTVRIATVERAYDLATSVLG